MEYIFLIIIKGIIVVFVVYLASYIIEKATGFRLLIDNFIWEKSILRAKGAAGWNSIFVFFLVNLVVLLNDLSTFEIDPDGYAFWKWFALILPLTIIFRIVYFKYTKKNPNKADNDWS